MQTSTALNGLIAAGNGVLALLEEDNATLPEEAIQTLTVQSVLALLALGVRKADVIQAWDHACMTGKQTDH